MSDRDASTELAAFVERLRIAGLDPAEHDSVALCAAWRRLQMHMQRLRDPRRPPGNQALGVFLTPLRGDKQEPE